MIEKQLKEETLLNFMEHNGIIQEMNRTFLHPLGIEVRINNETKQIEFWQTENPEGYLLDRINPIQRQAFQRLSVRKNSERQRKLGFGIQTQDLYRKDIYNQISEPLIPPKRLKLEILLHYLFQFQHMMFEEIAKHHKEKDDYLEPDQFSPVDLVYSLNNHTDSITLEDYKVDESDVKHLIDVANYAMMIVFNEALQKEMGELQVKAEKYNEMMEKALLNKYKEET